MSEGTNIVPEKENETIAAQPAKMEFKLINPKEDGFLRVIKWNKEELEAAVKQKIVSYENIVYTENNMKQAKADRAELNKLTKAIEERRKMVKRIINEPYDTFEAELKEVLSLIRKPVDIIDRQVKAFENQQKEEKKESIHRFYDEIIGDLTDVLPFEKVFDNRYLNQTYKLAEAQADLKKKIEKVHTDLETIDSLESKFKLNVKDVYVKTLDISKALAENKRLSELEEKLEAERRQKAEEEARKKHLEEERQRAAEERAKVLEIQRKARQKDVKNQESENITRPVENNIPDKKEITSSNQENLQIPVYETKEVIQNTEQACRISETSSVSEQKKEKKYRTKFCVTGTKKQLEKLIQFMNETGIDYGKVN
ncbi:MAG: DUF1351 domain-containing protein [Lachnospiraceae bacterium]